MLAGSLPGGEFNVRFKTEALPPVATEFESTRDCPDATGQISAKNRQMQAPKTQRFRRDSSEFNDRNPSPLHKALECCHESYFGRTPFGV